MSHRPHDQQGATLVEAALVLPVVLLMVFGLVDIGLWAFETTQATAAAGDGARAAIIEHAQADVAGSADHLSVRAAAVRHIDVRDPSISIACARADGSAVACDAAVVGEDRVRVSVSWDRSFMTFVARLFGDRAAHVSGTSTMVIVGRPLSGSAAMGTVGRPLTGSAAMGIVGRPLSGSAAMGTVGRPLSGSAAMGTVGRPLSGSAAMGIVGRHRVSASGDWW